MGSRLEIDPDGVRGSGGVVRQAPTRGTPSSAVTPPAADATSVSVAAQLGVLMATLGVSTAATNTQTEAASGRLTASAETYQEQDAISARGLSGTHGGALPVHAADVQMPTFAAPQVPGAPAVPAGGGIVPVTGHEIATVVHGGPGPQSLDDAAAALKAFAGQLDQSADTVRSGRSQAASSWSSDAADNADNHLSGLQRRYQDHAEQARTGASQASTHAANFRQLQADTPEPSVFTDLERRLYAANKANAQPGSMGRYSATIADLQAKLADANRKAIAAFGQYTAAAETTPVPSPGQPPGAAGAPHPSEEAGDPAGTDTNTSAALDDPNADPSLLDGATGTGAEMLQTVLPAVLGGISGAVGAGVGAVTGAAQKLQEVSSQAVGGLTQGMNAALTSAASSSAPKLGGNDGSGEGSGLPDFGSAGGGGGLPGDTEPASSTLSEPLSPPAVTAATSAPVVAAPATVSASTPNAAGSSMGMGGGGMVPPMMGAPMGGRGGGGSEEDKRQSPDRRLHIEEAPNAEPVKGRREARSRRGRGDSGTE